MAETVHWLDDRAVCECGSWPGQSRRPQTQSRRRSGFGQPFRAGAVDPTTAAFLRRVDTNGNGMIDEDEVTGGAKAIVEGILTRLGIELKYPIPLSKIVSAGGDRRSGSRDDDGSRASSSEDKSSSDDSSARAVQERVCRDEVGGAGFWPAERAAKRQREQGCRPFQVSGGRSVIQSIDARQIRPHLVGIRFCRFRPSGGFAKTSGAKVRAFSDTPGAALQGTAGVVSGEGRQWRRPSGHGRVCQRMDSRTGQRVQPLRPEPRWHHHTGRMSESDGRLTPQIEVSRPAPPHFRGLSSDIFSRSRQRGTVPFSSTIAVRRCPRKLGQSPRNPYRLRGL